MTELSPLIAGVRRQAPQGGFTLFEVMVALVVGGIAVAGAAALFTGMATRAGAIRSAAARVDYDANGERLLRSLLGNLQLSEDGTPSLAGDSLEAVFRAWCDTPAGQPGTCTTRLSFEPKDSVTSLRLQINAGLPTASPAGAVVIELRRHRTGSLRYLIDASDGGTWSSRWSELAPPIGIAVIIGPDTLFLPVWGSG